MACLSIFGYVVGRRFCQEFYFLVNHLVAIDLMREECHDERHLSSRSQSLFFLEIVVGFFTRPFWVREHVP